MKELTIKEEALDVVKQMVADGQISQEVAEKYFPELKESEDERVRTFLIGYFDKLIDENSEWGLTKETREKIITWLEKQGEQILANSAKTCKDEQKPADEVEPKFHKGEWIIHQGTDNIYQVVALIDNQYQLKYGDNYTVQKCDDVDRCARLWNITKDAKDGDVLIDKSGSRECPFIFKETKPSDIKTDILNPLTVLGYCGIGGAGFTKGSGWGDTANCIYYPATKEQRDTLMKAMADAGWEFDFEKKELKKIDDVRTTGYWHVEDIEQKPTEWSEEDEHKIKDIIYFLDTAKKHYASTVELDACIDWLKSLKDRYTWKPSEEQIKAVRLARSFVVDDFDENPTLSEILVELEKQLKKLRE